MGLLPDISADKLRSTEDGTCLSVGRIAHSLVVHRNEVVAWTEASVTVHGASFSHRSDKDATATAVNHFNVDSERVRPFLDADGTLKRRW